MTSSPHVVRGQVRSSAYRRVSHGLYLAGTEGLPPRERHWHELSAHTLLLPEAAGFTHVTAAWIHGWALPQLPVLTPVFAAGPAATQPRRAGLVYSRLRELPPPVVVQGLPVVPTAEVLLRSARDLALLDLVVMLDSAIRAGDVDRRELSEAMATSRPGARRLRIAHSWSDGRAESPFETLLRLFHEFAGVKVTPQREVVDAYGREVARGDLWVDGTNMLHEYDGEGHAARRQRVVDLRRERRLSEAGLVRHGFTAEDLLTHPLVTLQELDRLLGRRHLPTRLARWRREVALSTYSVVGRQRLLNRWLAYPGAHDCAKTAG